MMGVPITRKAEMGRATMIVRCSVAAGRVRPVAVLCDNELNVRFNDGSGRNAIAKEWIPLRTKPPNPVCWLNGPY